MTRMTRIEPLKQLIREIRAIRGFVFLKFPEKKLKIKRPRRHDTLSRYTALLYVFSI